MSSDNINYTRVRELLACVELAALVERELREALAENIAVLGELHADWVWWEEGLGAAVEDLPADVVPDGDEYEAYCACMLRLVWLAQTRGVVSLVRPPAWLTEVLIGVVGTLLPPDA